MIMSIMAMSKVVTS